MNVLLCAVTAVNDLTVPHVSVCEFSVLGVRTPSPVHELFMYPSRTIEIASTVTAAMCCDYMTNV